MSKKRKLITALILTVVTAAIIGVIIRTDAINRLRMLDLISGFSIRTAYGASFIFFALYIIYRSMYSEGPKFKKLIYVSIMNFSANLFHFTTSILLAIALTVFMGISLTSNTSTMLLVIMILLMISILSFEFDLVREKANLPVQSRFEKAHRKSLFPSLFLHLCIIAILVTTAAISRNSFNDCVIGITVVLWNTVYISTVEPYIMSKVIEWRNS